MGAAEATGKGIEITLRGKAYKLSPITINDLAEFETYIRNERMQLIYQATKDSSPEERREMLIDAMTVTQSVLLREINTVRGARFLIHRAMLPEYPEMTLEDVGTLCGIDNLPEVMAVLDNMYGGQQGPLEETEAEAQSVG